MVEDESRGTKEVNKPNTKKKLKIEKKNMQMNFE